MKKIISLLPLLFIIICDCQSQTFPNVDSVKKYIDDSIRSNAQLKATTLKKAYTGTAKFLPDAVQDTADVVVKAHGMHRFQRKDSTEYVYDTIGTKRWRRAGGTTTTANLQSVTDAGNTTIQPILVGTYVALRDTGYGGSNRAYIQDYFGTFKWTSPSTHPNMAWTLNGTSHSAARNYVLPNKSGTFAMLDDITGTNIYNGDGSLSGDRTVSLASHKLTFAGTSGNYPASAADSVGFKNTAVLIENSVVTTKVENIISGGVNYGHYMNENLFGSIFFRHYGPYATGCDVCGKNTMQFKWTQNAAWPGGVDTLLNGMGAHNGPGDHHFYLGDMTDTYANANRYITIEHNGAPFVGFYNNPVGNFAQSLFGVSTGSTGYSTTPNWENWHVIIGGKCAIGDTLLARGKVKFSGISAASNATDSMVVVNASTGDIGFRAIPTGGGSGGTPAGNYGNIQINRNGSFAAPGSDSLQYTAGAGLVVKNAAVFNSASGSVDFVVKSSGNATMFKVDGTNDRTYFSSNVYYNTNGDLNVADRFVTYMYSGNVYGGWHPSQGGYMVTPGVGYCFTNAANFNTIDASFQREAAGIIRAYDGGLGASGYAAVKGAFNTYNGSTWDGSHKFTTENDVRDKFESLKTTDEGDYTPTLTNTTNVAASTAHSSGWYRVGDRITVYGQVDIDPTSTGATELRLDLPVATAAFSNAFDAAGTAVCSGTGEPIAVSAVASGSVVAFKYTATSTANNSFFFTFTYKYVAP
jgi:hypothetical protein